MRNNNRQKQFIGPLAVVVALGFAVVGCSDGSGPAERGPVPIESATTTDTGVQLSVESCMGNPEATYTETDTAVTFSIISDIVDVGHACLDSIDIALDGGLGDRKVIDQLGKQEVPLDGHQ